MRYETTRADRARAPAAYERERRQLGYDGKDYELPYARFYKPTPRPMQPHVVPALACGMVAPELGYGVSDAADRLSRPGDEPVETGWTQCSDGTIFIAVRTDMPEVTARMWDWWFGWHSRCTARYKLWHPTAHQFAALGEDRANNPNLSDRERYWNNVSYVDEYIGSHLQRLAIRFVPPARLGFVERPEHTVICARVTLSGFPIAIGWLIHQVRPTDRGVHMRSRFFLNDLSGVNLPPEAITTRTGRILTHLPMRAALAALPQRLSAHFLPAELGPDLLSHCATEMNHLAAFLPELHHEFHATP